MDEVKKRTERMREEMRRKVLEHERLARANEGRPQVPLSSKLRIALPLAAIVVTLYSLSFYYTRRRHSGRKDASQPAKIIFNVRDIFAPEERTGEPGPRMPELVKDFQDDDDALILDDTNKKW